LDSFVTLAPTIGASFPVSSLSVPAPLPDSYFAGRRCWERCLDDTELELLRSSMTVRLGSIQVVTAGLLFAALKLT